MKTLYNQNTGYWYPSLTLFTLETIILAIAGWLLFF
jgi:hypothetical protein